MITRSRANGTTPSRVAVVLGAASLALSASPAFAAEGGARGVSVDRAAVHSTKAPRDVTVGRLVRVVGGMRSKRRGRTVLLELSRGGSWQVLDRAATTRGGRFRATWRPREAGSYRLRARPIGAAPRRSRLRSVHVYRASPASWFGPGLYGARTACGYTLGPGLVGVAHRQLPCRTLVRFRYRGRTVMAPVIDRGPYAGGREWDLTAAAKQRLSFPSTGSVLSTR